jgi:predicted TPR repeat methyltransferase
MTRAADALLERGDRDGAVAILERQTALYPNLLNGWWRLAGVAAGRGDTARAIALYRRCVEIDPSVRNFVERRIRDLQVGEDR